MPGQSNTTYTYKCRKDILDRAFQKAEGKPDNRRPSSSGKGRKVKKEASPLYTILGTGMGAAAGYGLGHLVDKIRGKEEDDSWSPLLGALAGAGLGGYYAHSNYGTPSNPNPGVEEGVEETYADATKDPTTLEGRPYESITIQDLEESVPFFSEVYNHNQRFKEDVDGILKDQQAMGASLELDRIVNLNKRVIANTKDPGMEGLRVAMRTIPAFDLFWTTSPDLRNNTPVQWYNDNNNLHSITNEVREGLGASWDDMLLFSSVPGQSVIDNTITQIREDSSLDILFASGGATGINILGDILRKRSKGLGTIVGAAGYGFSDAVDAWSAGNRADQAMSKYRDLTKVGFPKETTEKYLYEVSRYTPGQEQLMYDPTVWSTVGLEGFGPNLQTAAAVIPKAMGMMGDITNFTALPSSIARGTFNSISTYFADRHQANKFMERWPNSANMSPEEKKNVHTRILDGIRQQRVNLLDERYMANLRNLGAAAGSAGAFAGSLDDPLIGAQAYNQAYNRETEQYGTAQGAAEAGQEQATRATGSYTQMIRDSIQEKGKIPYSRFNADVKQDLHSQGKYWTDHVDWDEESGKMHNEILDSVKGEDLEQYLYGAPTAPGLGKRILDTVGGDYRKYDANPSFGENLANEYGDTLFGYLPPVYAYRWLKGK